MEVNVSKILRMHMNFFKAIGYCGLSFNSKFKRNIVTERCLVLWSCLLLVAFNLTILVGIVCGEEFLFTNDAFGYFNDILKVVFADVAVTISYLETILTRSEIFRFWQIYNTLQKHSGDKCNIITFKNLWKNCRFLVIFYSIVLLEVLATILFIIYQPMTQHLIWFNAVFTPFVYAVHMRNMQFIFYIEVLRSELVQLRHDLSSLVDYTYFKVYVCGFKGFGDLVRTRLLERQKHYQMIYEMCEHFQNAFGFSIVAVLLMVYVCVLVDVYFSYYTIYRELNKTVTEILLLIPAVLQIPAFLITSKNCMDEVKYITFNLHSISSQLNNQTGVVSTQLQNFSLQILHQRICINGIGISRMDGYMLTRAIGSVTTYMIFFIQFMPKFSYIQEDKKHE